MCVREIEKQREKGVIWLCQALRQNQSQTTVRFQMTGFIIKVQQSAVTRGRQEYNKGSL